ncbi:MAG: DUF917 domain-containing protein [Promethearchaeota archaeon]
MVRILTDDDVQNLIDGAKILGTGGGGDPLLAIKRVNEIYSKGKYFKIQDISDFNPTDMICIIGMVGGGVSSQDKKYIDNLSVKSNNIMVEAVELLENHLGKQFTGFVSTEMGPGNVVVPLWVGSLLDRITVDGDMCGGRSKPMISISTTNVIGISITPLTIASAYGDRIILKEAISDKRAEDTCRMISRLSNGSIGVARCPMTASECQKGIARGTISLAIRLGNEINEAAKYNLDPIQKIKEVLNAQLILSGKVEDFTRIESGGFTSGTIMIKSTTHSMKIWYQNEYLLSWLDGEQYITCPDSLLIVDSKTGEGLTPWTNDFSKEREITILFKSSVPLWKTKKGIEIFGPQVFHSGWRYQSY